MHSFILFGLHMKYIVSALILIGLLYGQMTMAQGMSTRNKIGQMLIIGFEGKEVNKQSSIVKLITKQNIGGVLLFDKNIQSPEQVQILNRQLQHFSQLANQQYHRDLLPLLLSVDYEGGKVDRLKEAYGFPATQSAADVGKMSEHDANLAAKKMAQTLKNAGFNLNFAPVLDVNVNAENPVIGKKDRSFSERPSDVAFYANLYSNNFISQGIQCAFKHFPGHGSSNADSHLGFVDVTTSWHAYELEPYAYLLGDANACGMVMTAHIVNRQLDDTGLPATLSHQILTGILREQLQFDGVIITDDMQMKAISQHYGFEQAVILAINAGADMFIFGNQITDEPQDPKLVIDIIEAAVKSGKIRKSRIDEAYRHIVKFKQSVGNQGV